MKIRPVGAEFFHANREKEMKQIATFHRFANAPEKENEVSKYKAQCL
jgi:hypothetical protein